MVAYRFRQGRFDDQEALINGLRILAVQRDHLVSLGAAAGDFESVGLNPRDDRVRDGGGRLAAKAERRSSPVGFVE